QSWLRALARVSEKNMADITDNSRRMAAMFLVRQQIESFCGDAQRIFSGENGLQALLETWLILWHELLFAPFAEGRRKSRDKIVHRLVHINSRTAPSSKPLNH